jgi:hypothetical protein
MSPQAATDQNKNFSPNWIWRAVPTAVVIEPYNALGLPFAEKTFAFGSP